MSDENYNAASRPHVRQAERESKREQRERREIVSGIMSVPAGRAWMLARLESCHVFRSSFATDALNMAFAEGERNVGLQLLNDIMAACPDRYVEMMRERDARDRARNSTRARPGNGGDGGGSNDSGTPGDDADDSGETDDGDTELG